MKALCTPLLLVTLLLAGSLSGCQSIRGPYASQSAEARDTARAERLTREAAGLIVSDPEQAEQLLRSALSADLYHGPAHNNLGVLHLQRGELYEAASEFEWARKLMPGHPDPRVNLAMTLERAGESEDAAETYSAALEARPGYLPAIQGLARLRVRTNEMDDETFKMLRTIVKQSRSETWRLWAERELALKSR